MAFSVRAGENPGGAGHEGIGDSQPPQGQPEEQQQKQQPRRRPHGRRGRSGQNKRSRHNKNKFADGNERKRRKQSEAWSTSNEHVPQQGRGDSGVEAGGIFGNTGFDSAALPYNSVPDSGGNPVRHGSVGYDAPYGSVGYGASYGAAGYAGHPGSSHAYFNGDWNHADIAGNFRGGNEGTGCQEDDLSADQDEGEHIAPILRELEAVRSVLDMTQRLVQEKDAAHSAVTAELKAKEDEWEKKSSDYIRWWLASSSDAASLREELKKHCEKAAADKQAAESVVRSLRARLEEAERDDESGSDAESESRKGKVEEEFGRLTALLNKDIVKVNKLKDELLESIDVFDGMKALNKTLTALLAEAAEVHEEGSCELLKAGAREMELRKQVQKRDKELLDEQFKLVRTEDAAKMEREALEARLNDLNKDLAEARSLCDHLEEELEDEKKRRGQSKASVRCTRELLEERLETEKQLEAGMKNIAMNNVGMTIERELLEERIKVAENALADERHRTMQSEEDMKRERVQLKASMTTGEARIRKAEKLLMDEQKKRAHAEAEVEKLKTLLTKRQDDDQTTIRRLKEEQTKLQGASDEAKPINNRLKATMVEFAEVRRKLAETEHDASIDRKRMKARYKRLRMDIKDAQQKRSQAEAEYDRLSTVCEALKAHVTKTEQARAAEQTELQARVEKAEQANEELQAERSKAEKALRDVERRSISERREFQAKLSGEEKRRKEAEVKVDDGENHECCVVCMKNKRQICFSPCKHVATCRECGTHTKDCPSCRKFEESSFEIFWP